MHAGTAIRHANGTPRTGENRRPSRRRQRGADGTFLRRDVQAGGGEGHRVRGQCPSAAPRLLRSKVLAPPRSVPSPQRSLCPHRRRARPRGAAAPAPRPQGSGSGGFRGCRVGAARLLGRPGGHVPPTGRRRPRPSAERPGGAWPPVHPQAGHCGHPTRGAAMSPSLSRRRQDGPGLKCDSGTSRTKHYLG